MGILTNSIFYGFCCYYICLAYFRFRKTGGIKGKIGYNDDSDDDDEEPVKNDGNAKKNMDDLETVAMGKAVE